VVADLPPAQAAVITPDVLQDFFAEFPDAALLPADELAGLIQSAARAATGA
jgi:hypothetical protein